MLALFSSDLLCGVDCYLSYWYRSQWGILGQKLCRATAIGMGFIGEEMDAMIRNRRWLESLCFLAFLCGRKWILSAHELSRPSLSGNHANRPRKQNIAKSRYIPGNLEKASLRSVDEKVLLDKRSFPYHCATIWNKKINTTVMQKNLIKWLSSIMKTTMFRLYRYSWPVDYVVTMWYWTFFKPSEKVYIYLQTRTMVAGFRRLDKFWSGWNGK